MNEHNLKLKTENEIMSHTLETKYDNIHALLGKNIKTLEKHVDANFTNIKTAIENTNNCMEDIENMKNYMKNVKQNMKNIETTMEQNITTVEQNIDEKITTMEQNVKNVEQNMEKNITNMEKQLNNNIDDFQTNINNVIAKIDMRVNTIDINSNKNLHLLREQIQNSSSGFTMIPLKSGSYCDINCETLLFCGIYTSSDPFNNRLTGVKLCVDDKNHILLENLMNYATDLQVFQFLEQFRKIKSIYFEIGGTKIETDYHTANLLVQLFHHLTKINPSMDIHFTCKDIWHDPLNNASEILTEFTKTTNYASFHLKIENNFVKDAQTGNMRNVSSVVSNKIKEHCVNNNIIFVSNIGI